MCQGKGSLSHNNREFTAKNIDPSRTPDNIIFKQQDLGEAYHQLFDGAVANYNAKQKRNDRKIPDCFQHLFNREKLKSEAKRISREDELSRELRKAKAFISACGLSSDFQQYKYNSNTRKKTLE